MPDQPTEKRRVESHDPTLSDHANRLLTAELQQVVGAESVTVPLARHDAAGDRHATHSPGVADLTTSASVLSLRRSSCSSAAASSPSPSAAPLRSWWSPRRWLAASP